MVRRRLLTSMFGGGALALAACGGAGDQESAPGSGGKPSGLGGAVASTGNAGKAGGGGNASVASGAGGTAASGPAGGATSGGTAGDGPAGGSPNATAGSGASAASGAGTSPSAGTTGRGTGGNSANGGGSGQAARGGASGRGSGTSGATAGDGDAGTSGSPGGASGSDYDAVVLADGPVLYLAMNGSGHETDLTGNGHDGIYQGGSPARSELPNGDEAADFDGVKQYLTVPSSAVLSIPTKHELTWEAWIHPDVLQFTHSTGGYVDWMGKCEQYAPTCEWEARMYSMTNSENRCNRLSAYAFNPDGDLGSGAFWQQTDCGTSIQADVWYHVVGEYTTLTQPSACSDADAYPGSIDIWVNGVEWRQASHGDTGCMSQYQIVPTANDSPLNIGTMAHDAWFEGAIAKVAVYDKVLKSDAIARHYQTMTGRAPTGSCSDTCAF